MTDKKTKEVVERKEEFRTTVDGMVVNRIYTPADLEGLGQEDIGLPGEYPFTRHIMMPRSRRAGGSFVSYAL